MKLNIFNAENSRSIATGTITLRIGRKSGLFSFSKAASIMIGVSVGDRIVIVQDEDSPVDFFCSQNR
ncbi:MAG: hypothetical protein ACOYMF_05700 [Bacteroidales bacterium]